MTNTQTIAWFELLTDSVAEYIDDATSEVYAMRAEAPRFARIREEDQTVVVTLLTNDKAELISGEARLTGLPGEVVAATIESMLR